MIAVHFKNDLIFICSRALRGETLRTDFITKLKHNVLKPDLNQSL